MATHGDQASARHLRCVPPRLQGLAVVLHRRAAEVVVVVVVTDPGSHRLDPSMLVMKLQPQQRCAGYHPWSSALLQAALLPCPLLNLYHVQALMAVMCLAVVHAWSRCVTAPVYLKSAMLLHLPCGVDHTPSLSHCHSMPAQRDGQSLGRVYHKRLLLGI